MFIRDNWEDLIRVGWQEITTHSGKSSVLLSDAIDVFMMHTEQEYALPSLMVAYSIANKSTNDEELSVIITNAMIQRFNALV